MTKEELIEKFQNIKVHKSKGKISVHKPLLILLALKAFKEGQKSMPYEEIAPTLNRLIKEIGNAPSPRANYPFVRLVHDKIWSLNKQQLVDDFHGEDPTGKFLVENKVSGGFTADIQNNLTKNPENIEILNGVVTTVFFEKELHKKLETLL
ncbi:MAG: hypothetical protein RIC30_15140 [Marinoscillum sp.]|uniref:hypothetical protein n=1 Tax=Marinoscillum sp. TaxID=2024838 RepID=UPI0032F84F17